MMEVMAVTCGAELDCAHIHVSAIGPHDGDVVLCLHNIMGYSFLFDDLSVHLANRGFRVISFGVLMEVL